MAAVLMDMLQSIATAMPAPEPAETADCEAPLVEITHRGYGV